ncbi:hypothetical protein MJO28_017023 [Puccinia striiformis f. sp. tritici]|nr:hypothetical protein MJO28_017023 [Puccinia striiformis f. sp. tritici]
MKIINFFQQPHIASLILAIVFTSRQALAATTPSRSCNQYFFLGKTPGVACKPLQFTGSHWFMKALILDALPCGLQSAEVTMCRTNASSILAQWITNLVSYDSNLFMFCEVAGISSALFKKCDLLDKERGNLIPGRQLETMIPLQYHVEAAGVAVQTYSEAQNKDDLRWYRCANTDFNNHRATCTSCTVQA